MHSDNAIELNKSVSSNIEQDEIRVELAFLRDKVPQDYVGAPGNHKKTTLVSQKLDETYSAAQLGGYEGSNKGIRRGIVDSDVCTESDGQEGTIGRPGNSPRNLSLEGYARTGYPEHYGDHRSSTVNVVIR